MSNIDEFAEILVKQSMYNAYENQRISQMVRKLSHVQL